MTHTVALTWHLKVSTRGLPGAGVDVQTARAHSSTEAEVVSLDRGMRDHGDLAFVLLFMILKQYHKLIQIG